MKLIPMQRQLLEVGLTRATTNKEKWRVIHMVIVPEILGQKITFLNKSYREPFRPWTTEYTIHEVLICVDRTIFFQGAFWKDYNYIAHQGVAQHDFSFEYNRARPILDGNKLTLGAIIGHGDSEPYIMIE